MARGWRMLDAWTFEGQVSGARGLLTFHAPDGSCDEIPAADVALVIIGPRTTLDSRALHYLAKHDVAMLRADWTGKPTAGLFSWSGHGRVAARHIAQARLSIPRKKNAWKQLVAAKIRGQSATLSPIDAPGTRHLARIAAEVRSGDPTNAEGTAARIYWRRLFADQRDFFRDRDRADSTNSKLNYGYMVLRGHGIRAVLNAGLSPPLGVFHSGRSNYFNLVDDLIEPFRPAIDSVVVTLGVDADLNQPDVRRALVAGASQPFTEDGRRIPAVLEDLAQQFGRYVEKDIDRLPVPHWSGVVEGVTEADDGEHE